MQYPSLPATLQEWQGWLQAPLQQTPWTQLPLAHWPATVQALPWGRLGRQAVDSQKGVIPAHQAILPVYAMRSDRIYQPLATERP